MKKKLSIVLLSTFAFAYLLSGCGSAASDSAKAAEYAPTAAYEEAMGMEAPGMNYRSDDVYEMDMVEEAVEEPAAEMNGDMNGSDSQLEAKVSNRKLIKTVSMDVETKEFDSLIATITARIEQLGGYMESMNVSGRSYGSDYVSTRNANIVARIPAQNLNGFVSTIEDNSNITNKNENTEDVTLQYTDVRAHRDSLRVEQERLNELLAEADSLETIIALEERLTEVRYELESYESRLRSMDNQVDYSTVYLYVNEVKEWTPEPVEEETFGQRISKGFTRSCKNAWGGFQDFLVGFVSALPIIVIVLVVIGIIGLIIFLIVKGIISGVNRSKVKKAAKLYKAQQAAAAKAAQAQANANKPEVSSTPKGDADNKTE